MTNSFSYACSDYPGKVTASTKEDVWRLMAVHADVAHGENTSDWTHEDRTFLDSMIKES